MKPMSNQTNTVGHSLTDIIPVRHVVFARALLKRAFGHATYPSDQAKVDGKRRIRVRTYPQSHAGDSHQMLCKNLLRWMLAATAFFLMLVAIILAARYAYNSFEEKRQVAKAQAFLAAGNYLKAETCASIALDLNPTDVAACRAMADSTTRAHLASELFWVQRLADVAPTTENKLRLAETGLRCQTAPFPVTTLVLNDLAGPASSNPAFHIIAGNLAIKLQQQRLAEAHFLAAVQLDPGNQEYALNLATVQLHSPDPAVKKQARQQLENLGEDPKLGPTAFRTLVADCVAAGDDAAASHYSDQLLAMPQVAMADRLENLGILQRINPVAFKDRLQFVMDLASADSQTVAELSTWMQSQGLAAENIDWLGSLPRNIRSEQSFKLSLLQAYLQSGKWQSVIDWGIRDNWSDKDFLRVAFLSHAWAQLGLPTVAQSNWGEAVNLAGDRYEAMTNLLVLAERWQLSDAQLDLRQRIMQLAPQ
jgi:tetratricopeptide (TPR) repeat protein